MRGYSAAPGEPRPGRTARLVGSSIGGKFLMAGTGLLLLLFVIGHLLGNLQVFSGPAKINKYSQFLADLGWVLWAIRIALLAIFFVHVFLAVRLDLENRDARPQRYRFRAVVQATWTSRTMLYTGILVGAYIVYHLLHFTLHVIDTGGMGLVDAHGNKDVYSMLIAGFSDPAVAASYIVATLILGLHLWHAIGSAFQTLGWDHPTWAPIGRALALALPPLITLGYLSIPVAIWSGLVP